MMTIRHAMILLVAALGALLVAFAPRTGAATDSASPESRSTTVDSRSATVGMSARIDQLRLPGTELEVVPIKEEHPPLVLRIAGAFPHGSEYRYDLVYYGLEPGRHDLGRFLRRKDGGSTADLPAIEVEITPVLPPGQVLPNALEPRGTPPLGGYRALLIVAGVLWLAGLLAILFWGRSRRRRQGSAAQAPRTLADRLRPLVEKAIAGKLERGRAAELERTLLAYWRRRLQLDDLRAADAIVALREHGEAGRLLEQLDRWLHRPGNDSSDVDIAALLAPYRDLPEDALDGFHRGADSGAPGAARDSGGGNESRELSGAP